MNHSTLPLIGPHILIEDPRKSSFLYMKIEVIVDSFNLKKKKNKTEQILINESI